MSKAGAGRAQALVVTAQGGLSQGWDAGLGCGRGNWLDGSGSSGPALKCRARKRQGNLGLEGRRQ